MKNWEFIDNEERAKLTFDQLEDGHWYVTYQDTLNRPWLMTRFLGGALIGLDGLCWSCKGANKLTAQYTEVFPVGVFKFKKTA